MQEVIFGGINNSRRNLLIHICEIQEKDAERFLQMVLQLDGETTFMMYEPTERKQTVEEIRDRIHEIYASGSLLLLACDHERIVGFLSADKGFANRIRHSAYLVIGILEEYRGKGIGRRLFEQLFDWSGPAGIRRLELTVLVKNEAAVSLYQRMGFQIEGLRKKSMCLDGEDCDEYYMARLV